MSLHYYYVGNVGFDQNDKSLSSLFDWSVDIYSNVGPVLTQIFHILYLGRKCPLILISREFLVRTEIVSMESAKSRGDRGI